MPVGPHFECAITDHTGVAAPYTAAFRWIWSRGRSAHSKRFKVRAIWRRPGLGLPGFPAAPAIA